MSILMAVLPVCPYYIIYLFAAHILDTSLTSCHSGHRTLFSLKPVVHWPMEWGLYRLIWVNKTSINRNVTPYARFNAFSLVSFTLIKQFKTKFYRLLDDRL